MKNAIEYRFGVQKNAVTVEDYKFWRLFKEQVLG